MATDLNPAFYHTIDDTFTWAPKFLDQLAACFGSEWVSKRLEKWRWSLSIAFSGVGCAENVKSPDLPCLGMKVFFSPNCLPPTSLYNDADAQRRLLVANAAQVGNEEGMSMGFSFHLKTVMSFCDLFAGLFPFVVVKFHKEWLFGCGGEIP